MILSKCMCTVIITWMIRMHTFSSILMSCPLRFFNFKAKCISVCKFIIPKYHLLVAGDIHQSHDQFSDISQGKQCAVMSFSAMFNTCWLNNWQLPEQIRFLPREIDSIWKPCHLIICSLFLSAYCFHTSNHYCCCSCSVKLEKKNLYPPRISDIDYNCDFLFCYWHTNAKNSLSMFTLRNSKIVLFSMFICWERIYWNRKTLECDSWSSIKVSWIHTHIPQ